MKSQIIAENILSVTIAMVSYNDERIIYDCLDSIFSQDYPKEKLYVLLVDGGSTDNTLQIASNFGAKIISRPDLRDDPSTRSVIAATTPETDIFVAFSADNRFQEKDCLRKLVEPFSAPEVVASETFRYGFKKSDPVLSRYLALIGCSDPIAIGLGKADRAPHDAKHWHSFGEYTDMGDYFKIKFSTDISKIPTIGANGCAYRKELLDKFGVENAGHTDLCVKLIRGGYSTFAFVKEQHIIHYIDFPMIKFFKRRLFFAEAYSPAKIKRIYYPFTLKDLPKLVFLILINLTFLIPFIRAIRGFLAKPDPAWFLHPLACFIYTVGYGVFYTRRLIKNLLEIPKRLSKKM